MFGAIEQVPREDGVEEVLDCGFARVNNAGEVEMVIRLHDQLKMEYRAGDAVIAMGQIGGEYLTEVSGERRELQSNASHR